MGAGLPRDLVVPGRGFENIVFAMDFLRQQNRRNAGLEIPPDEDISARGRIVVVIGGGDTGSDCVGTARRQGAKEIHQFEILPQPPAEVPNDTAWPTWPRILRTSSSHEEGCHRRWGVTTKRFSGRGTRVEELHAAEVSWTREPSGRWTMKEIPGSEFAMKVDLVLLAMGFVHVEHGGLVEQLELKLDGRGNVAADDFATSAEGVFAAGDTIEGASLVVRAIRSGRDAAAAIDRYLARQLP
jgi:glutamate synthase (NADPH/NADH) small chain